MSDKLKGKLNNSKFDAARAAKFDLARAKGSLHSRSIPERISNVDAEARTAEFSFASNKPIEHWFGYLILDTTKEAVVLDRVANGVCQHLFNHDADKVAGVVLSDSITFGSEMRGKSKFSRSDFGNEIFQDVVDEIRNGISIGFLVHELVMESETEGVPTYRATKWEILEVSTVSIPADISVGMGRDLYFSEETDETQTNLNSNAAERSDISNKKEKTMKEDEIPTPAAKEETRATAPAATGLTVERELAEMGELLGETALARQFITEEKTVAEFRAAVKAKQVPATPVPTKPVDVQLARSNPRYGKLRNFKGEGAEERAHKFGMWFMAGPLGHARAAEFCKTNGILLRTQNESSNEKGGFLVPEEIGNDLIDLREQFGVFRRNAKIVPMASDVRSDPRRTSGLTAYFVGESAAGTQSDKGWDRVELVAKKLMVLARISSELNEDAAISIGDDLAGEIAYAFAEKEDQCGFNGDGTSTYGGIIGVRERLKGLNATIANIAGLVVGAGNAYSELVLTDFEAVVGKLPQYADTPMAKWFVHRSFYYNVMVKLLLAAGGVTAAEIENQRIKSFLGYAVEFSQVMPKAEANSQVCCLLGDLTKAASLGSRRDTTIALSEHSRFTNDEIEIKGTERFDINVHDVGNADATAGNRVEGPVVGLITAAS